MDPITAKLMSAAGAAAADPVYVDDVFSIDLWTGTGSARSITNGIDISGEGGMIWTKSRTLGLDHYLSGPDVGTNSVVRPNSTNAKDTSYTSSFTAFNSNGFSLGTDGIVNYSGTDYVGWTFRKCPGFFDVVTWTGTGSTQNISHNLGSVPGMIIVKNIDLNAHWAVYHRELGSGKFLLLNDPDNEADDTSGLYWGNTTPTSSVFTVGTQSRVNGLDDYGVGYNYVAYIFAHDDQSFGDNGNEAIIKCGSYTGTGSAGNQITLGFEPQWLIVKNISTSNQNWEMFDNMRGVSTGGKAAELFPNTSSAERSAFNLFNFNATGFATESTLDETNASGDDFIYMAIRRPHKPPSAGTDVFKPQLLTSYTQTSTPGFAPDWVWQRGERNASYNSFFIGNRIAGNGKYLHTATTNAEGSFASWKFDAPTGEFSQTLTTGSTNGGIQYFFKRAAGFFDVVAYTGDGVTGRAVPHGLGVAPELLIVKNRDDAYESWGVYAASVGSSKSTYLNGVASGDTRGYEFFTGNNIWNSTDPTATAFTVKGDGQVNGSGDNYIAYLFATLPGISKVGSYTGTGNNINVDCGFTAGARFVFIKRSDDRGNWYQWDSARGIVAGNDPYVLINTTAAEVTNTDYIDPLNAGFTVTSSAPAALNSSGGTYLFLAIA